MHEVASIKLQLSGCSFVHWCPTELVLGLLMSGILLLSYRKQIQVYGTDILSLLFGQLCYWQFFAALVSHRNISDYRWGDVWPFIANIATNNASQL